MSFLGKAAGVIGVAVFAIFVLALIAPHVSAYSYNSGICSSNGYTLSDGDCEFVREPSLILGCHDFSYNCARYPSKYQNGCVGYDYYDYGQSVARITNTYWNSRTKQCEYYGDWCVAQIEYNSPKCGYRETPVITPTPPTTPTRTPSSTADISITYTGTPYQAPSSSSSYGPSYGSSYGSGTSAFGDYTYSDAVQSPTYVGGDYSGNSYQSAGGDIFNNFGSYTYDNSVTYTDSFNTYTNSGNTYNYGSSGGSYGNSYYSTPRYSYYTPSYYPSYSYYPYSTSFYTPTYSYAAYSWTGATRSPSYYAYWFTS